MSKISSTLLAVSQLMNEKSAKTVQKFMVYLDKVYRPVSEFYGFRSLLASRLFWSILTTFEASIILEADWFELKIEQPQSNLACLNRQNTLYHKIDFYFEKKQNKISEVNKNILKYKGRSIRSCKIQSEFATKKIKLKISTRYCAIF